MLIAQGPLRVSLFGGGSDLPAFLEHHDGAVLSFAIDRRIFIVGHPFTHREGIVLKYSKNEDVENAIELQHPIAREILHRYNINDIDIAVMADVPAGTGLGSSSSFTVAFLAFVRHLCNIPSTPVDLAREACEVEIEILKEPIGYQDQWASALGGVNVLRFQGKEVEVESIGVDAVSLQNLQQNLYLVPIGKPRSASDLLAKQGKSIQPGSSTQKVTQKMVGLVDQGKAALIHDIDAIGPLLDEAWALKRSLASAISNPEIDAAYELGLKSGATGGKLLGAGGSGYLAFYVPKSGQKRFSDVFPKQLNFSISTQGAGVIHES